jgi:hypothetical protein
VKKDRLDRLLSDGVLGTIVVLMTIATAIGGYRAAVVEIRGSDLDFKAQSKLSLGTTTFLQGSIEYVNDLATFESYLILNDSEEEAAYSVLARGSEALTAGLERPGGPFDEVYEEIVYGDALALFAEARDLNAEANAADDLAADYQRATLVLAIGLATAAWASLVEARTVIRLVFTLISLPFFFIGLSLIVRALLEA